MTDLTEQWKKGELPEGWYWVEYSVDEINGVTMMKYMPEFGGFCFTIIKQVLAEVPDYVEWQNMVNCACEEHEANHRLLEENAELKELLKECRLAIYDYPPYDLASDKIRLMQKIDEVLNA